MNRRALLQRLLTVPAIAAALPVLRPRSRGGNEKPLPLEQPLEVTFGQPSHSTYELDTELAREASRQLARATDQALMKHDVVVVDGGNGFGEFRIYGIDQNGRKRLELVQLVAPGEHVRTSRGPLWLHAWSDEDTGLGYELAQELEPFEELTQDQVDALRTEWQAAYLSRLAIRVRRRWRREGLV